MAHPSFYNSPRDGFDFFRTYGNGSFPLPLGVLKLLMESRDYFPDEILEARCRYADKRTFDVVPGFQSLVLLPIGTDVRNAGPFGRSSRRVGSSRTTVTEHRRQEDSASESSAEHRHRMLMKLLLPIGCGAYSILQLLEI
jgi:hypothetical protein